VLKNGKEGGGHLPSGGPIWIKRKMCVTDLSLGTNLGCNPWEVLHREKGCFGATKKDWGKDINQREELGGERKAARG